ncbi:transmembrane protein 116 isoform X10 [Erpetoichthys calabaricus]|nr:transmembrane protein 116 isoform X2 [Erpetoichthys calabaricus]XP_051777187.1 transmembrane protein 116 isoform X6 [Erpetoichthys calabaricus]XP_051777188.1 transmembrane protein 116 isoform X7 [Erpetoichthys calabaricus]XP_051777189.1 transmembrane protein 116 isoform X8 [Erpetoichthys calabaricus]XP_051777190.1 transmembrane protein 116 isoform X9 [Erpetoichthys calabaricus]XP_051777191.1 transmembrane protein 116 isoform X10 [Erpetoichthys calabaricus]
MTFSMENFISVQMENLTGPESDWSEVHEAVRWIQFFMALLSIAGAGGIIVYAAFQNLIQTPEVRPLFYLSLSDVMLGVSWLIGALLYQEQQSGKFNVACYNMQPAGEIFYIASFLYTVNYTGVLYQNLKEKCSRNTSGFSPKITDCANQWSKAAIILSSLIPVVLMTPVFAAGNAAECYQNFSEPYKCLLMHRSLLDPAADFGDVPSHTCPGLLYYRIAIFLLAFFATFIGILVMLVKARTLYKKTVHLSGYLGDQQWANINIIERRVILYPSVFLCCWGPAILLLVLKLIKPDGPEKVYAGLYVIQALTSASQGLLNCFVYGWTQHSLRFMKKAACRDVDTQTPLLRCQKKSYATLNFPKFGASSKPELPTHDGAC